MGLSDENVDFAGLSQEIWSTSSHYLGSSPPPSTSHSRSNKPKKPPPVTPRRFNRFFTPRSSTRGFSSPLTSKSRRQLRELTGSALNSRNSIPPRSSGKSIVFSTIEDQDGSSLTPKPTPDKKRKSSLFLESSPAQPSPSKRPRVYRNDPSETRNRKHQNAYMQEDTCVPIRKVRLSGTNERILQRSFGPYSSHSATDHCTGWEYQTQGFYSLSSDVYSPKERALPFCSASCNTNPLVAVGDEDGRIHLLDSANSNSAEFSQAHLTFNPHENALMDAVFSSDDKLLATASGDQSSHVIDIFSQRPLYIIKGHHASVKQVRFQPGNDNIIATSGRDGTVRLWDLRCRGRDGPVRELSTSFESGRDLGSPPPRKKSMYASQINAIVGGHASRKPLVTSQSAGNVEPSQRDGTSKKDPVDGRNTVSVTALQFLPSDRSHLILTASESSTSVKLWDVRGRYTQRRGPVMPISTTREPESHEKHRHFGVNSLLLNSDGSRLYALSKDNSIYAYSTNHLVLGHAPELSATEPRRHRHGINGKEGLRPLYAFRHPSLLVSSFYVKAALRPAAGDKSEMLAVGSSDGSPILFPTDERYINRTIAANRGTDGVRSVGDSVRPFPLRRSSSNANAAAARMQDTIPVNQNGTALVGGHNKEVTGVTWTTEGNLVALSDDVLVRCWREGPEARDLRVGGEAGGRRWGCGWAELPDGFDDED